MEKAEINIYSEVNEVFAKTLVTYKILNDGEKPIELEVLIDKNIKNNIFSSFEAQIGNSIRAKSKVIKTEKAEEKFTDTIASGNAAIYTTTDKDNKNIIVHIGNIPPKEELTFTSEFIQYTESANNSYEYELFRNIPIMRDINGINIYNAIVKGTIEIKTKSKIKNIDKHLLNTSLTIEEEKNDKDKNSYIMKYYYKTFFIQTNNYSPLFSRTPKYSFYTPASKLLFDLESNNAIFYQNSLKNKDEQSYIFNYKITDSEDSSSNKDKNKKQEDIKLNPALFIFLIDQSYSMGGSPIKVASKALLLFLQSLPAGSYYQIIGFGSNYQFYDKIPKEYNQKNI